MEHRNRKHHQTKEMNTGEKKPESNFDPIINGLPLNNFRSPASFVMVLNGNIPIETKHWLICILKNNHLELSLVKDDETKKDDQGVTLLISCSEKILLENYKFVYKQLKEQKFEQEFSSTATTSLPQLNSAERQRILSNMIQRICSPNRTSIVGLPDVTLYPGQSIIEICCHFNIITHYFPLHDYEHLENLRYSYCAYFGNNIDYVRNYFGEMIGFYFSFLNHYRDFFCVASVIYVFSSLCQLSNELYTLILCFGVFVFIKMWKRLSKKLAFDWGTIDLFELEKARPAFRSKGLHLDSITEQLVPYYPITKTWCKEYFISVPFVIICLCLSFELMCIYFQYEDWAIAYYDSNPCIISYLLCFVPCNVYAVIVMFLNHLYIIVATKLNDYENHKTQESHENHLIVKLVLFEFFNNFISLFYIAFYMKDMYMLKINLITMLTANKTVENLLEVFIPMFMIYRKNPMSLFIKSSTTWKEQIYREKNLFRYEHTYYDCLELFIQFGYAFLFLAIWPWAPLVACFNSILEVRMDAIKLCYCKRRPFQKSMKSINNAWIKSFEVLAIVITISNLLVLGIVSEKVKFYSIYFGLTTFEFIVYFEHMFLTLVLVFWYIVPDVSKDVHSKLNRRKYLQLLDGDQKKTN